MIPTLGSNSRRTNDCIQKLSTVTQCAKIGYYIKSFTESIEGDNTKRYVDQWMKMLQSVLPLSKNDEQVFDQCKSAINTITTLCFMQINNIIQQNDNHQEEDEKADIAITTSGTPDGEQEQETEQEKEEYYFGNQKDGLIDFGKQEFVKSDLNGDTNQLIQLLMALLMLCPDKFSINSNDKFRQQQITPYLQHYRLEILATPLSIPGYVRAKLDQGRPDPKSKSKSDKQSKSGTMNTKIRLERSKWGCTTIHHEHVSFTIFICLYIHHILYFDTHIT